jgi:dihydrodipicolinate synthase/N-acetylneuraminate lyase
MGNVAGELISANAEKIEMKKDRRKLQVLLHLQELVALKTQVKAMKEAHEREKNRRNGERSPNREASPAQALQLHW